MRDAPAHLTVSPIHCCHGAGEHLDVFEHKNAAHVQKSIGTNTHLDGNKVEGQHKSVRLKEV